MSKEQESRSYRYPSTLGLLGVAFVVLKLCGVINWSWWWVTAPFWGIPVLMLTIFLVSFVVAVVALSGAWIIGMVDEFTKPKYRK